MKTQTTPRPVLKINQHLTDALQHSENLDLTDAQRLAFETAITAASNAVRNAKEKPTAKFTFKDDQRSGWVSGTYHGMKFQAKVYDEGSEFGINNGTVSKLWVSEANGTPIINYDRGWDKGEKRTEIWKDLVELIEVNVKAVRS